MSSGKQTLIISPQWIITADEQDTVLTDHSVVIENELITDICPTADIHRFQGIDNLALPDQLLMPGLINSHCHGAMSLFRGMADDVLLQDWLNEHIWPAEAKWVCEQFVQDGTTLAIAEMLLTGTSCFNDMYFYPNTIAQTIADSHIRACVSFPVLDFPSAMAQNPDEYIHKGLAVHDDFKNNPLVTTAFGPHAPYTVSDAPLRQIKVLADELQIPVHMHVHESADEVSRAVNNNGKRPLQRLNDLGLLSSQFIAVHMTQVNEADKKLLSDNNCHVVHCPASNMKLASGTCPVDELSAQGINVCLGTDSAASNNNLDMFEEMKIAALLAKNLTGNATTLAAEKVIRMATINGARALGLNHKIGSVEKGKQADLITIDFSSPLSQPVHCPASSVVYGGSSNLVSNLWVAGRQLLQNRELTEMNAEKIVDASKQWLNKIRSSNDLSFLG